MTTTLLQATRALLPEAFRFSFDIQDLVLLPANSGMACEVCESPQTLTERSWADEDGDPYYNVLCGLCRAKEVM